MRFKEALACVFFTAFLIDFLRHFTYNTIYNSLNFNYYYFWITKLVPLLFMSIYLFEWNIKQATTKTITILFIGFLATIPLLVLSNCLPLSGLAYQMSNSRWTLPSMVCWGFCGYLHYVILPKHMGTDRLHLALFTTFFLSDFYEYPILNRMGDPLAFFAHPSFAIYINTKLLCLPFMFLILRKHHFKPTRRIILPCILWAIWLSIYGVYPFIWGQWIPRLIPAFLSILFLTQLKPKVKDYE